MFGMTNERGSNALDLLKPEEVLQAFKDSGAK